jgi:hypothetical protein
MGIIYQPHYIYILNKGSKYNVGIAPKKCIKQLVCKTENAIRQVNINQQEAIRYIATKNIQRIISKQSTINREYKQQIRTTKQIKLQQHKATVTEMDKGKTMIIIYEQDLDEKVNSFMKDNHIIELKTDPTQKMQRTTQNTRKQCKIIIGPTKRKCIIQTNPQAPRLKAENKIYKALAPIRPVISSIHAPTHEIPKYIHQRFKDLINLKYEYNIINATQFAENMKLNHEHELLMMDIKDPYVKIPISYTLNIANKFLNNNRVDEHII